jgi:hypothetical protein
MTDPPPDESTRRSVNQAALGRIGAGLGGISIAFSTLCFFVMPMFTPAFMLAALFGSLSGAIALTLKARRTAMVAFVFALVPLLGFLLMQYAAEPLRSIYVVFVPLGLAVALAAWSFRNYLKALRASAGAAA